MKIFNISFKKTPNGISIFLPTRLQKHQGDSHKKANSEFKPLTDSPVQLNVGGAKGHPKVEGWTVVDMRASADINMNIATTPLPFEDNSVDVIFSSHTLEHIYPQQLDFVLKEFHRVMKKDHSLLRILVPDIQKAVRAYQEKDLAFFEGSTISPYEPGLPLGGQLASWFYTTRLTPDTQEESDMKGHVHCFDEDYMRYRLERIGFQSIWSSSFQRSSYPAMRSDAFDRHPNESLFIEAMPS